MNFFNNISYLEPRCPKCDAKIEYGVTTKFDDKVECHKCLGCGTKIE